MEYLEGLNEPQKEAVLATEGPLMIIAGAKKRRRLLISRQACLICRTGGNSRVEKLLCKAELEKNIMEPMLTTWAGRKKGYLQRQ